MYDLSTFCHICFKTNKKLDNIDSSDEDILENLRYIGYETDWLISVTPIKICSDCFYLLNITTNFKQIYIKNNQCLKEYVDKLKNGAQNKRVDLHVYLKRDQLRKKSQSKPKSIAAKQDQRTSKSTVVKHLKPIRNLVLDCRVSLERICVFSELQKLKNGGRDCAPKLTNDENVKLKNGVQNKHVDLHDQLHKSKSIAATRVERTTRSTLVKHLKPIHDLGWQVNLERIKDTSELQKLKIGDCLQNGERDYAPKLTNDEVQLSSDELFIATKQEKLRNAKKKTGENIILEQIPFVENVINNISGMDSEKVGDNSTAMELEQNLAPKQVKIAENVVGIENHNSGNNDILKCNPQNATNLNSVVVNPLVPNRIKSVKKVVHADLDELFPNPEDAKLKEIINSLTRISKMSKPSTTENTKNPLLRSQLTKPIQKKTATNSPALESGLNLIKNITSEFNGIFKTLITYSNNTIDTLSSNNIVENHQNTENTPHQNRKFATTSEELFAQLAEEYCVTPTVLTPNTSNNNAFQNGPLNHLNNNINQKITSTNVVKKQKYTRKTKKTLLEKQLGVDSDSMQQYSNLPTQFNDLNVEQQIYLPNYNLESPKHSSPILNYDVPNNTELTYYHIDSDIEDMVPDITPLKSNPNIIDTWATKLPDYDGTIAQNTSASSNDSAYFPDASTLQLQNLEMANEILLNCEVVIEDADDCESRVLTEKCVLCEVTINSNSNYCQPCFTRLNQNLHLSNRRECINCCQPLEENACLSLFCDDCSNISTFTSVNKVNVFGKLYSHCVVCCKIFKNQSVEIRPNFVCRICGPLDKFSNLKLLNCDLCPYRFLEDFSYVAHKKEHELKQKECPVCFKRFKTAYILKKHFNVHSRTNIFKCPICSKEFTDKYPFKNHVKLHSGIKDIKCLHCDQMFVVTKQLNLHMRNKHPECLTAKPRKMLENKSQL